MPWSVENQISLSPLPGSTSSHPYERWKVKKPGLSFQWFFVISSALRTALSASFLPAWK